MIDAPAIGEIIATYTKHGWILRRVLLSAALAKKLGSDIKPLFGNIPQIDSTIDAAWFSRPPKPGGVAWEIRYLGDIQFALLESMDESDAGFEAALKAVESRLAENVRAKESA